MLLAILAANNLNHRAITITFSVEKCEENLTASSEQKEYEIISPEEERDCDYTISTETPGNGIAVTIMDDSSVNGTFMPWLCRLVEVTITTSA